MSSLDASASLKQIGWDLYRLRLIVIDSLGESLSSYYDTEPVLFFNEFLHLHQLADDS